MNKVNSIAVIVDGNRRWAKKNKKKLKGSYFFGAQKVFNMIDWSIENKIKNLTFYLFSADNWKRSIVETNLLFLLFEGIFLQNLSSLEKKKVEVNFIGNFENIPNRMKEKIKNFQKDKKKISKKIKVFFAVSYSGKEEIISAIKKIPEKEIHNLTEKKFENFLWSNKIIKPEIIIRTGGAKRLSNFLLWKSAYSELFFLDKLWPDFSKKDFLHILERYKSVKINNGK